MAESSPEEVRLEVAATKAGGRLAIGLDEQAVCFLHLFANHFGPMKGGAPDAVVGSSSRSRPRHDGTEELHVARSPDSKPSAKISPQKVVLRRWCLALLLGLLDKTIPRARKGFLERLRDDFERCGHPP